MALSEEDRTEIKEIISGTLKSGCLCGLSPATQTEMGHLMGRLRDIGNGNLSQGIEIFSKCIEMIAGWRKLGEKVGGAVAVFMFVSLIGGLGTMLVVAIKAIIKKELIP